jgi:CheR methyltransferase, SAM binding domain
VIAPLVEERATGQAIRAWTPACSTGEEAYSLAMVLLQHLKDSGKHIEAKVFATDPAPQALSRARAGLFPDSNAETMPRERLTRFFEKEDSHYRAKKSLREAVMFAPQKLLTDPPFSHLDLVTCRNLLIFWNLPCSSGSSRCFTSRCARAATCSSAPPRASATMEACSSRCPRNGVSIGGSAHPPRHRRLPPSGRGDATSARDGAAPAAAPVARG